MLRLFLNSPEVDHIKDNFNVFDFELTKQDMDDIAKLNNGVRYYTRTDEKLMQFAAWHPTYELE